MEQDKIRQLKERADIAVSSWSNGALDATDCNIIAIKHTWPAGEVSLFTQVINVEFNYDDD